MNSNIAKVIAIELAILIVIVSWLAYSRFPSAESHPLLEASDSAFDYVPVARAPKTRRESRTQPPQPVLKTVP